MSRLAQDMKKLAHRAGGSHKTVHDREQMAQRFARHLLAQNIQVTSTCQLKARHIAGYIHEGTVAKLAMRQPFVLFKGLTFQKLCLPGAFRPGDHHNKMLRPG
ncbi:phage integrase N-terminal domain-containing protein, partial [Salmonella enterica]|uniref:phage integrase N-terminal domain-containing protein n=1 Tax=Salmonella enterica TaxID=28901 RepID=UPI003CF80BEF